MQAPGLEGLSFDPFPLVWNGLVPSEGDVGRRDVVQALMVTPMVVVIDDGFDLSRQIAGQDVVFQQDPVLQGLMPPLDLALGLRLTRCAPAVFYPLALQPFSQIP